MKYLVFVENISEKKLQSILLSLVSFKILCKLDLTFNLFVVVYRYLHQMAPSLYDCWNLSFHLRIDYTRDTKESYCVSLFIIVCLIILELSNFSILGTKLVTTQLLTITCVPSVMEGNAIFGFWSLLVLPFG